MISTRWLSSVACSLPLLMAVALLSCDDDEVTGGDVAADTAIDTDGDTTDDTGGDTTDADEDLTDIAEDVAEDGVAEDTVDGDADTGGELSLPDFIPCDTSGDCPIGFGGCVTEIPLNRIDDDDRENVLVSELDPDLDSTGICTLVCTNNQEACATLTLPDARGTDIPFQCQVVFAGLLPYPLDPGPLPFDDELDADSLADGQAFAAICVPPFGVTDEHIEDFCDACSQADECTDGLCWDFGADIEAAGPGGICLEGCSTIDDCPFGFNCEELVDETGDDPVVMGDFCVPYEETCSSCVDRDDDGRGLGRCGRVDAGVTAYDCDDGNADAYYDPNNPNHAFPEFCGEYDYNCNGLSDAWEQVGPASDPDDDSITRPSAFPAAHCTACYDTCSDAVDGTINNAVRACAWQSDGAAGWEPICAADCVDYETHADCDGLVETGCETEIDDPAHIYYADTDEDGRGDPDEPRFDCGGTGAPEGYVDNDADCDDDDPDSYGAIEGSAAHPEVCDGADNDCNDEVDDGGPLEGVVAGSEPEASATEGTVCVSDGLGVCEPGTYVCPDDALLAADGLVCQSDVEPGANAEVCDGEDNDCDGYTDEAKTDEDTNGIEHLGDSCDATGSEGICFFGALDCVEAGWADEVLTCVPGEPDPNPDVPDPDGIDSDCDGVDGNVDDSIFVSAYGNNSNGGLEPDDPVKTLQEALEIASNEGRHFVLATIGDYDADTDPNRKTVELVEGIHIYGGYSTDFSTRLSGGGVTSVPQDGSIDPIDPSAPASRPRTVAVRGEDIAAPTVISDIRFTMDSPEELGADVYGLYCRACTGLSLVNVTIEAADGRIGVDGSQDGDSRAGADGGDGNPGTAETTTYTPGGSSSCGADGGYGGSGGEDGWVYGDTETRLREGDVGGDGTSPNGGAGGVTPNRTCNRAGNPGDPAATVSDRALGGEAAYVADTGETTGYHDLFSGYWVARPGQDGADGLPGGGGGGGSGSSAFGALPGIDGSRGDHCERPGSAGGSGGAGGCGGLGGPAGGPGGSSFGMYLLESTLPGDAGGISFENVRVCPGEGGDGGRGGPGGDGGVGGAGGAAYEDGPAGELHSGSGGDGGSGSGGGGGAGGAGGNSYGAVIDSSTDIITGVEWKNHSGVTCTTSIGSGGGEGAGGEAGTSYVDPPPAGADGHNGATGPPGHAENIYEIIDYCGGDPPATETCNDNDDDCDAQTDEAASGLPLSQACYTDDLNSRWKGICRDGTQECEGPDWGTCTGQQGPETEICDGLNNDCDAYRDEGCPSDVGASGMTNLFKIGKSDVTGSSEWESQCLPGEVLIGIRGEEDAWLNRLGGICGTVELLEGDGINPDGPAVPYDYRIEQTFSQNLSLFVPNIGGDPFSFTCPPGEVVTRMWGSVGGVGFAWLLRVKVRCSALDITGSPGSYTITTTNALESRWFGDENESDVTSQACPDDAPIARGLRIWTSVGVDAANLRCGTIDLETR